MTEAQERTVKRMRREYGGLRGVIEYRDGTVQVGYETPMGRDREAVVDRHGKIIERANTYEYA
jgi:hypothetical protein